MATTAVQAVEKNITSVALADIQPSNYNPRKTTLPEKIQNT